MRRVVKMLVLVVLIVLVVVHYAATHDGAFYDIRNIASHEAIVTFLAGMMVSLALWGKKK